MGRRRANLVGERIGTLTVLEECGSDPGGRGVLWRCQCDCGRIQERSSGWLLRPLRWHLCEACKAGVPNLKGEKVCSRCLQTLPAEQFYHTRKGSPNLQSRCKRCQRERDTTQTRARRGKPCRLCWDLAHRRPRRGCPGCGKPYVPEVVVMNPGDRQESALARLYDTERAR